MVFVVPLGIVRNGFRILVIGLLCTLPAGCLALGALAPHPGDALIVAILLLPLAFLERSALLAAVAAAVAVAGSLFDDDLLAILLPAIVLLLGGVAALVLRGRPSPAGPPGTMER